MQTINLSQLRNTRLLKAWLKAREMIALKERNRVLAWIIPVPKDESQAEEQTRRRKKAAGEP